MKNTVNKQAEHAHSFGKILGIRKASPNELESSMNLTYDELPISDEMRKIIDMPMEEFDEMMCREDEDYKKMIEKEKNIV